jgi:hypothetical protein
MKKRISRIKEQRIKKRNQLLLGLFLVFVMFGSVFAIVVNSFGMENNNLNNQISYNNYNFFKNENYWITQKLDNYFLFKFLPNETNVENFTNLSLLNNYYEKPLYINSENIEAKDIIKINLIEIVQRVQDACEINKTCNGNYPIKDCSNNFIIIKESNKTSIEQKENCVYINSPKDSIYSTTEEFLYKILEIK